MTPQIETNVTTQRRGPGALQLLVVGLAALAIAIGGTVALGTAAPAMDPASAVGPGGPGTDGLYGLALGEDPDGNFEPGSELAAKAAGGKAPHHITIAAKDGTTLTLKTDDGWTRKIAIESDTVITKGGVAIKAGDLNVGDPIAFRQVRNTDGSYKVTEIRVLVPHVGGVVTAVGSGSLTIKLKDGSSKTITLPGTTKYALGPRDASLSTVKVGSKVDVAGTISGDTFTAISVKIQPDHLAGDVTATTSSTITIKKGDGTTATIKIDGATTFKVAGKEKATLADITAGMRVDAEGTLASDGSLAAITVDGHPAKAAKAPKAPGPKK